MADDFASQQEAEEEERACHCADGSCLAEACKLALGNESTGWIPLGLLHSVSV